MSTVDNELLSILLFLSQALIVESIVKLDWILGPKTSRVNYCCAHTVFDKQWLLIRVKFECSFSYLSSRPTEQFALVVVYILTEHLELVQRVRLLFFLLQLCNTHQCVRINLLCQRSPDHFHSGYHVLVVRKFRLHVSLLHHLDQVV